MAQIDMLLAAAREQAARHVRIAEPHPTRRLAVVTCMDARIDVHATLGLCLGEAVVIRNAGARVTDDVLRSLAVAVHLLGVTTVVVMQHTGCGLAGRSEQELRQLTGADLDFCPIDDHTAVVRADVESLFELPFLRQVETIAGLVYDLVTGQVEEIVRLARSG